MAFVLTEDCELVRVDEDLLSHCAVFTCGASDLDEFLYKDSMAYENDLMGKTYCWLLKEDNTKIIGFVTLANAGIQTTHLCICLCVNLTQRRKETLSYFAHIFFVSTIKRFKAIFLREDFISVFGYSILRCLALIAGWRSHPWRAVAIVLILKKKVCAVPAYSCNCVSKTCSA